MRCEDARLLISAGLDGEAKEADGAPLEAHLATCHTCQQEQAALAGTVQWLRALPESEPPASLRGRIAVALLEEERRAQRRHLGWAWLARPQTAGWAWGAAAGAMLAAVTLVTSHGGSRGIGSAPSRHPVSSPTVSVAEAPRNAPVVKPAAPKKSAPVSTVTPDQPTPPPEEPRLTAVLPPVSAPVPVAAPPALEIVHRPMHKAAAARRRRATQEPPLAQMNQPHLISPRIPRASTSEEKATPRPVSTDRDAPKLAWMNAPAGMSTSGADARDADEPAGPSGMTDMASMPTSSPPTELNNDLEVLRHRLTDRPLQAPELGQLKPANSGTAGRDGWIRF